MTTRNYTKFIAEFLRKPREIGAIVPSSRALSSRMTEWIDWDTVGAVVEYGPGMGAFTGDILSRMRPGARYFAVEIDAVMVAVLKKQFPGITIYQDSVKNIKKLCEKERIETVDAIICGLPWALFSEKDQTDFLDTMMSVLRSGGQFTTFAYLQGLLLPAAHRFKRKLKEYFLEVELSNTVWWNLPPAFTYRCRR
jgi:phosphatidylethanolamine/phosphatidyl-N-methylethanolamine N-methyltransferase